MWGRWVDKALEALERGVRALERIAAALEYQGTITHAGAGPNIPPETQEQQGGLRGDGRHH